MKISYLVIAISFWFAISTCAQSKCKQSKSEKLFLKAKKFYGQKKPVKAKKTLYKSLKACATNQKTALLLAEKELANSNTLVAEGILQDYIDGSPKDKIPSQVYFFLGKAEWELDQFNDCAKHMDLYLDSKPKSVHKILVAKRLRDNSLFSIDAYKNPDLVSFTKLAKTINSQQSEYLPILTADEKTLLFTRRIGTIEELLQTKKQADGQWSTATYIANIPSNFRKAAATISADGETIIFAMADHPSGLGNFDLFQLQWQDNQWKGPHNLGTQINSADWDSQPCLSPDGNTLYFCSSRRGGQGGNDLWVAHKNKSSWQQPKNLGTTINSNFNEESPFIHRDGQTLYFRSNSHPGMGDFDIFLTRKRAIDQWSEPLNLGFPINSKASEGSLYVYLNGQHALMATDMEKTTLPNIKMNQIDIYEFDLPKKYQPISSTYVAFEVVDVETKMPLLANILIVDVLTADTIYNAHTNRDGRKLIVLKSNANYACFVQRKNYEPKSINFALDKNFNLEMEPYELKLKLNKIKVVSNNSEAKPIVLENVHFETASSKINIASTYELNSLVAYLKENPSVKIELSGHTDNIGLPEENKVLSLDRAKSVFSYLVSKGINSLRITYRGFGDEQAIATNETEEGRRKNRRTEFIIHSN